MHDGAAIELSGLTKRYRRGKDTLTAVDNVTLSVPAGQVIGLLGPNGAGKTTVIKMIAGLILPSAGTIRLGGHDVGRQRADAVRQIGAVLEGSRNVYWPLSAWQNLLYFGRLKGLRAPGVLPPGARIEPEQEVIRILLPDADQAVLYKVLDGLRANGVPLRSVSPVQPDLEEVFLRLIRPGGGDGRAATADPDASRAERVA